ncbi:hypothetical protein OXX69_006868 [Metschnikowia pulcherrima]
MTTFLVLFSILNIIFGMDNCPEKSSARYVRMIDEQDDSTQDMSDAVSECSSKYENLSDGSLPEGSDADFTTSSALVVGRDNWLDPEIIKFIKNLDNQDLRDLTHSSTLDYPLSTELDALHTAGSAESIDTNSDDTKSSPNTVLSAITKFCLNHTCCYSENNADS